MSNFSLSFLGQSYVFQHNCFRLSFILLQKMALPQIRCVGQNNYSAMSASRGKVGNSVGCLFSVLDADYLVDICVPS